MDRQIFSGLALLAVIVQATVASANPGSDLDNLEELKLAIETHQDQGPMDTNLSSITSGAKNLTLSGLLEISATYHKSRGQQTSSDLQLATAQLRAAMAPNENICGHVSLLYEESTVDQAINVDEALISIQSPHKLFDLVPTLNAGRLYLPFGCYASAMITDPLTLELGETTNTALVFGLEGESLSFQIGIFSGEIDRRTNSLDTFVAALTWRPQERTRLGVSYHSDLAESGGGLVAEPSTYDSSTNGFSAHASIGLGAFALSGEIVAALENFDPALINLDVDGDGTVDSNLSGARPFAWNAEVSWIPAEHWQVTARYENSRDFLEGPSRYGVTGSYCLCADTVLALEYLQQNSVADQTVTAQLSFSY